MQKDSSPCFFKNDLSKEAQYYINKPPSAQTLLLHLMKLSLQEITCYEKAMRAKNKGNLPAEIVQEIKQNLKRHQEDFGKQGSMRKLILSNE